MMTEWLLSRSDVVIVQAVAGFYELPLPRLAASAVTSHACWREHTLQFAHGAACVVEPAA